MSHSIYPDKFKQEIIDQVILPTYKKDIIYMIKNRTIWSYVSTVCTVSVSLLIALSTIMAFIATQDQKFALISGLSGILSLVLKEFGSFALSQDHIRTVECNKLFAGIGINMKLEDLAKDDIDIEKNEKNQQSVK